MRPMGVAISNVQSFMDQFGEFVEFLEFSELRSVFNSSACSARAYNHSRIYSSAALTLQISRSPVQVALSRREALRADHRHPETPIPLHTTNRVRTTILLPSFEPC